MPYKLIWEEWGVVFRFSGVASDHDLKQSNIDVFDHPSFETLEYQIADFSDVTRLDFSSDGIRWGADWVLQASKWNPNIRVAIVGEDQLLIGLANMYRIEFDLKGGFWEQEQFATMDEARAWLVVED